MLAYDRHVTSTITDDSLRPELERGLLDHDQAQAMLGDEPALPLVIDSPLLPATDTGDRLASVEERRWHGVLLLLELDHEVEVGPVAVNGQLCATRAGRRWIAAKPVERRLPIALGPEHFIAQVEHVVLVGGGASGHGGSLAPASQPGPVLLVQVHLQAQQPDQTSRP